MTEHPIIFSGPMVRAILEGRKTQTRRVMHFKSSFSFPHIAYTHCWRHSGGGWVFCDTNIEPEHRKDYEFGSHGMLPPYGNVGDRLWVREAHYIGGGKRVRYAASPEVIKTEDGMEDAITLPPKKWRSPIFMPRWASRITLEITDVRVQRVREISEEDAQAEGVEPKTEPINAREWLCGCPTVPSGTIQGSKCVKPAPYGVSFMRLWDSINSTKYPWADNPWVWVRTFKRIAE